MPTRFHVVLFAFVAFLLLVQVERLMAAQGREIDSLRKVLRQPAVHETARVLTLLQLARRLHSQNAVEIERTARAPTTPK